MNVHAPLKSCFAKNDKPKIVLDRNKFLTGNNFKSENEASLLKDFIDLNTKIALILVPHGVLITVHCGPACFEQRTRSALFLTPQTANFGDKGK